jgi:prevent-host-death family protein
MQKVGSREFKNRMGKYMRAIRKGQSPLLTDRGKPIAKVIPLDDEEVKPEPTVMDILKRLEAEGKLRLGKRPLGKFRAIPSRGKSASEMILEDRR